MRIVLSGIFYPMAILRYFEAALKRREDVELFSVGPYPGTWIPWNGGMNLPQKYAGSPDAPLTYNNGNLPVMTFDFIEDRLPWTPDLWLQVDAGWYLRGSPKAGLVFHVGTDPHCLDYDRQRAQSDKFFCMQQVYAKSGDYYLPYAYDPIWHAPEEQSREYDVCLIGLHYQQRDALVEELRRRGLRVYYDLGPSFDEARALYNQAPIGLNWSSLDDLTARVFELLAMQRLAVVNQVPDLARFFENGRDLVTFRSLPEAVDKAMHYFEHPTEAEAIARQGHRTVRNGPHTWDARIEQIVEAAA